MGICFTNQLEAVLSHTPDGFSLQPLFGVCQVKWSCFLGQVCGFAKMHLVYVHAAFRVSLWPKYAASGVRLSRAV